jgi:hypothetical protein
MSGRGLLNDGNNALDGHGEWQQWQGEGLSKAYGISA